MRSLVSGQAIVMMQVATDTDHGREVIVTELMLEREAVGAGVVGLSPAVVFGNLVAEWRDKESARTGNCYRVRQYLLTKALASNAYLK